MTECIQAQFHFSFHRNRPIVGQFDGGRITSDAGLLPLREFDQRHELSRRWAATLSDARLPERQQHSLHALFTQRLYQIVAGYEDANDAALLRHDPIFQLLAEAAPGQLLGSQPTLSRWENAFTGRDWVRLNRSLLESFAALCAARIQQAGEIVLDVDSTADPTYGQQEFSFYNGCYERSVYHPLLIFERATGYLLAAHLRDLGQNSQAIDASELIVTDENFQDAVPYMDATRQNVQEILIDDCIVDPWNTSHVFRSTLPHVFTTCFVKTVGERIYSPADVGEHVFKMRTGVSAY